MGEVVVDPPGHLGEPATLEQAHGRTFEVIGTTAGYWVLENRRLATWLWGEAESNAT